MSEQEALELLNARMSRLNTFVADGAPAIVRLTEARLVQQAATDLMLAIQSKD